MTVILKWMGLLLLVFTGFAAGMEYSKRVYSRLLFWNQLSQLLAYLEQEIFYRATPISQLFRDCQSSGLYTQLITAHGKGFGDVLLPEWLGREHSSGFQSFFQFLGVNTSEQFCQEVEYLMMVCKKEQEQAERRHQATCRLYPKLGLCLGGLVAILLF